MIFIIFVGLTIFFGIQISQQMEIPDEHFHDLYLKNAISKEFPSSIALFHNNTFECSATLITRKTAITTASCCIEFGTSSEKINDYGLIGGVNSEAENIVKVTFNRIIVHPGISISFNYSSGDYRIDFLANDEKKVDVCLMILDEEVNVTDYVKPIALPTEEMCYSSGKAVANGWELQNSTYVLKKFNAEIINKQYCEINLPYYNMEYKEMCGKTSHTSSCLVNNESGGSLIMKEDNEDKLVGILRTSYGCRCVDDGCPLIYIEIKKLLPWILRFAVNDSSV